MAESQSGGGLRKFFNNTLGGIQDKLQYSGNSTFYPVNALHQSSQESVKTGWLKKQGGVMKSWHRRWFNLKGDQLHYFTTQDEGKVQGSIWLLGNNVTELSMNPAKPEDFLFEIIPGADRTQQDTYLMCASSDDERKSWVAALKRVMFAHKGGAIFGSSLRATIQSESRLRGPRIIPEIIEMCALYVVENGLETEGIFRLPGRASLIRELKERFDQGERPVLHRDEHDVPTIASLLKQYLRDLPEPLIPKCFYERVMKVVNREMPLDPDLGALRLRDIICDLPAENYTTLKYLCSLLNEIASHCEINKMTPMNLATVFVHSVIRPEDEDPALLMGTANSRTQCTFFLMVRADEIFTLNYEPLETTPVDNLVDMSENGNDTESGLSALEISETITESPCFQNEVGNDYVHVSSEASASADDLFGFADNHFAPAGNLPTPLVPKTVEKSNPNNRRGSRKGRVFSQNLNYGDEVDSAVYVDSDQVDSLDQHVHSHDMSPESDPGYETIEDLAANSTNTYPQTVDKYPNVIQVYPQTTHNNNDYASQDQSDLSIDQSEIHQTGYSHLSNYSSNPQGAQERLDDDDYSYLPDNKPILRKKPSIDGQSRPISGAPKIPPKPRPRTSLKSRSSNEDINSIYSLPFDSISESEQQVELRERSSILVSQDLDLLCTREDLISHVEQLNKIISAQTKELCQVKGALHKEKKQYEHNLKEKEDQVAIEKAATTNAVNRVMSLQSDLQRYITKYGSIICDT